MFNHKTRPLIKLDTVEQQLAADECQQQVIFTCDIDLGNITNDVQVTWFVNNSVISDESFEFKNLPATITDAQLKENGINYLGYLV